MTLFQIALKTYGEANARLRGIEMVNVYGKSAEERLELDRQYGEAIHDAVMAKYALDALQVTGPAPSHDATSEHAAEHK